ncbi:Amidohydro-rel domain-containing protein [Citrus sinensis]|uniref:Amidohydro-rel domain-containing protein n=1 Tax=Citrus sinensis TaxID=2711 RepID=A0ACB8LG52_CITSI|nr:Amidohydro-rel domain-containing protein [Citrus sinensis]
MAVTVTKLLKPLIPASVLSRCSNPASLLFNHKPSFRSSAAAKMATTSTSEADIKPTPSKVKIIDSHLHVWASPEECMEEAGVDGALIVQPINHKFDHSLVTSVLKKYPSKFVGCCLANPAEDGIGIKQLEQLILKDGFRAVRFNPYLWPSGQQMTNEVGKAMFSKAGELGVPVGFMCMKGLNLHISEIEELCTEFPSTTVLLDHLAFCKPPSNDEESLAFSNLLKLSRFPQVYVKFSALFRVSRMPFPYQDLSSPLSQVVSSFGANRVMWGSDFPYVVPECGYKGGREAASLIANEVPLSPSELEWIMGGTIMQLFQD